MKTLTIAPESTEIQSKKKRLGDLAEESKELSALICDAQYQLRQKEAYFIGKSKDLMETFRDIREKSETAKFIAQKLETRGDPSVTIKEIIDEHREKLFSLGQEADKKKDMDSTYSSVFAYEEKSGGPEWFDDFAEIKKIQKEIKSIYTKVQKLIHPDIFLEDARKSFGDLYSEHPDMRKEAMRILEESVQARISGDLTRIKISYDDAKRLVTHIEKLLIKQNIRLKSKVEEEPSIEDLAALIGAREKQIKNLQQRIYEIRVHPFYPFPMNAAGIKMARDYYARCISAAHRLIVKTLDHLERTVSTRIRNALAEYLGLDLSFNWNDWTADEADTHE